MINDIFSSATALAFVLALLGLLVWVLKRTGLVPGQMPRRGKGPAQLTVTETRMLDARNRLVIVRWHGREYLLGSGANGVTMIGTHDSDFEKLLDIDPEASGGDKDNADEKA